MAELDKTTEYINKDEILRFMEGFSVPIPCNGRYVGHLDWIIDAIRRKAPADVAPVVHARWHYTDAYPHWVWCPNCNRKFLPNMEWIGIYNIPTNYCPCCGAKMDESEDEE